MPSHDRRSAQSATARAEPISATAAVRVAFVLLLLGSLAATAVGPAAARPPPQGVCEVCGWEFEQTAERNGLPLSVEASALDVRVDDSGVGHWTARVTVNDSAAEALAVNATLREHLVRETYEDGFGVDHPRNLTTRMNGDDLVVSFRVPGMAHRGVGGVLVVDHFYWADGDAQWFYLDADRMTVRGPNGTAVTRAPQGASVENGAVVWTGSPGTDPDYEPRSGDEFDALTYTAFAPDDGVASSAATELSLAADTATLKAQWLDDAAAVPTAVFAVAVLVLATAGGLFSSLSLRRRALAAGGVLAALLGVLFAVGFAMADGGESALSSVTETVFVGLFGLVLGGGVLGVLVAALAPITQYVTADRWLGDDAGPSLGVVTRSAAALLAVEWLALPLAAAGTGGLVSAYGALALIAPGVFFLPLGVAHRRGDRLQYPLAAGIALGAIPVAVAGAPYSGFTALYFPGLYGYWAVGISVLGLFAYAAGWRLAGPTDQRGADGDGVATGGVAAE